MSAEVEVRVVREADEEVVAAFGRLLPQLSAGAQPLDAAAVAALLASDALTVLAAWVGGRIVGTLTLVVFTLPTGVRARIEDVVVDDAARGKGVGAELTRTALALAEATGARTVDLTSRPSREAANRLYVRVGFRLRDSNVYRFTFDGE
jgi:ribosomal protein S18 acetylase RimI-like enzyme